jgi:ATP-dependent helicase HepA
LETIPLDKGHASLVRSQRQALEAITSRLLPRARDRARAQADRLVEAAKAQADSMLRAESNRLQALASINPNVRPAEISYWQDLDLLVQEQLQTANLRLDALRLILMKP